MDALHFSVESNVPREGVGLPARYLTSVRS